MDLVLSFHGRALRAADHLRRNSSWDQWVGVDEPFGGTVVLASALVLLAMGGTASAGYDHLLAQTTECGRSQQTSPKLSADKQEAVMRCMHNYARKKVGKGPLAAQSKLTTSAGNKAVDVQKCRDADYNRNPHDCGPGNTWYHVGRAGYCYSAAGRTWPGDGARPRTTHPRCATP